MPSPPASDTESGSLLDTVLLAEWEDRAEQGLFRYDVTACPTKVVPGAYGFVAQCNEGRGSKKRPTEFRVDKVRHHPSHYACFIVPGLASFVFANGLMCSSMSWDLAGMSAFLWLKLQCAAFLIDVLLGLWSICRCVHACCRYCSSGMTASSTSLRPCKRRCCFNLRRQTCQRRDRALCPSRLSQVTASLPSLHVHLGFCMQQGNSNLYQSED